MAVTSMDRAIASRVQELLDHRALKQVDFARILKIHASTVSLFLGQKRPAPDVHTLAKMAKFLGVTVGYLLHETDRDMDSATATLIDAFSRITAQRDRTVVLNMALTFADRTAEPGTEPPDESGRGPSPGAGTTKTPKKRR